MRQPTYIYILFTFLLCCCIVNGKPEQIYFKSDFPNNIPAGEEFEVSTLFKMPSNIPELTFYVTTDFNSSLKFVKLKSDSLQESLSYKSDNSVNLSGNVVKLTVGRTPLFTEGICQLVFGFNSRDEESTDIGIYYSGTDGQITEVAQKEVTFYEPQTVAGKCLKLTGNASLSFNNIFDESQNKLGIEFWLKTDLRNKDFFRIYNSKASDESLLNLVISNFGCITSSDLLSASVNAEFFTGDDNWNHIFIVFDKSQNLFELICNDSLSISFDMSEYISREDLGIEFFTEDAEGSVFIDDLRLWEYSCDEEDIITQKHFNTILVEDAELLYSYQFNSKSQLNSEDISRNGIKLVKSDAPIFSKAPTIGVSIFDKTNRVSIRLSKLSGIETLTVEKSYDGSSYSEVQRIGALTSGRTEYSISDYDDSDNEIVYYRVKQITEDGDVAYSNSAKVGRGKQIHFEVNQNYPNPFNPATMISINIKKGAEFQIRVYDVVGKLVTKLFDGYLNEGTHEFEFIAKNLPSGIYFAEVKSENEVNVMKMILAK